MDTQFQEFPKFKHHPDKGANLVNGPEQEAALGAGWHDSPADFPKPEQAETAAEPETAKPAKPNRKKKENGE